MDYYAKVERLSDKSFKQIIGVEKSTFDGMIKILKETYVGKLKKWKGRRKKKLTMEKQFLIILKYLSQYITQKEFAFEFDLRDLNFESRN